MTSNLDFLLEESLNQIAQGVPEEEVLRRLPDQAMELAPLIRLACATKAVEHPSINPLKARAQLNRLTMMTALDRNTTQPRRYPMKLSKWFIPAAASVLAAFFVLVFGMLFAYKYVSGVRQATLMDVNGIVERSNGPEDWIVGADGDKLTVGDRIRTRTDSSVVLVFADGSRTEVGPLSELIIDQLNGGFGRSIMVQFHQTSGITTHSVVPLKGKGSFFKVLTPAGLASVHGTKFSVDVAQTDGAIFSVDHGEVEVTSENQGVTLLSGQATYVEPGTAPDDPAYEFTLQGTITSISENIWTVANTQFLVEAEVPGSDTYTVGSFVTVQGRVTEEGVFFADRISAASEAQEFSTYNGVLAASEDGFWLIGNHEISVNAETVFDGEFEIGDVVEVTFAVQTDGSWLAVSIKDLEDQEEQIDPTGTPTSESPLNTPTTSTETPITATETTTSTPDPNLTLTPSLTPTLDPTFTPQPSLEGNRSGCDLTGKQHPQGINLATRFNVSYEEIMGWFCQGYGFGEIDLAYDLSLTYQIPVEQIFELRASGLGWGQIKQMLQPTSVPKEEKDKGNGNGNGSGNDKGKDKGNNKK